MLDDKVAKNMLYIEALATVSRGTMEVTRDVRDKLAALKTKGQKKEVKFMCSINFRGSKYSFAACTAGKGR